LTLFEKLIIQFGSWNIQNIFSNTGKP